MLKDDLKKELQRVFKALKENVKLVVFTQKIECQYCEDNRKLIEEVAAVSDKISTQVHNFAIDKEEVEQYGIDKIPATVVEGEKDYGIRFYGIPAGYEFTSLIEAIKSVSLLDSALSTETKQRLKELDRPVHIQVFVTPTCPYCARAVVTAHKLALENEYIKADMIEASEFPHLINKYTISAVPKVVINETISFEGALPEKVFVDNLMAVMESKGGKK